MTILGNIISMYTQLLQELFLCIIVPVTLNTISAAGSIETLK